MILKMLNKLRRKMEEYNEKFNKELKNIKKNQTELKNAITEIKNTLEGNNSKLGDTQEWIHKLEGRGVEITQAEHKKGKRIFKNEDSLRDLWDNIKHTNIHIAEVPEREE